MVKSFRSSFLPKRIQAKKTKEKILFKENILELLQDPFQYFLQPSIFLRCKLNSPTHIFLIFSKRKFSRPISLLLDLGNSQTLTTLTFYHTFFQFVFHSLLCAMSNQPNYLVLFLISYAYEWILWNMPSSQLHSIIPLILSSKKRAHTSMGLTY